MASRKRVQPKTRRWTAMILPSAIAAGVLIPLAGGGFAVNEYIHENLVTKSEFLVVKNQADLLTDARLELLIKQRNDILAKKNKSPADLRDLDYLEKQIDYLRRAQKGK